MRVFIAGLIGGIVLFLWGAIAHVALPIGEMGMKVASDQDAAIAALQSAGTQGQGVYMLPGMEPEKWRDKAAMQAFVEKYKASPSAFVVYNPNPNPSLESMGPALGKQFAIDVLVTLLAAWVMSLAAVSFGTRVAMGGAMGLIAWFAISVPYWNWYCFPMEFTIGALLDSPLGLLIASIPMAWWLGRRR